MHQKFLRPWSKSNHHLKLHAINFLIQKMHSIYNASSISACDKNGTWEHLGWVLKLSVRFRSLGRIIYFEASICFLCMSTKYCMVFKLLFQFCVSEDVFSWRDARSFGFPARKSIFISMEECLSILFFKLCQQRLYPFRTNIWMHVTGDREKRISST